MIMQSIAQNVNLALQLDKLHNVKCKKRNSLVRTTYAIHH